MALTSRKLDVTFQLGEGDFGDSLGDTVTLSGLRVHASIVKAGLPSLDRASVRVFGLNLSIMNKLSRLGKKYNEMRSNKILVSAGDDTIGMSQVFSGTISDAFADFEGAPESCLDIQASVGLVDLAKPVPPLSFPGGADITVIASQIAASMGKGFQNNGVVGRVLTNQYLSGTALQQLRTLCAATGIRATFDDGPLATKGSNGKSVLEIWPADGARFGTVPVIGPTTGMVGYPQYCDVGVRVRALFSPGLIFGGQFQLDTSLTSAQGLWNVLRLSYDLQSETPGGAWFQYIDAYRPTTKGLPA